ncbi:ankyrin repeat domain-containing protein 50-like [Physella acuta]|uniref:ankyrin repeat domain-containing protein 50-like n=1 Tax=Physella acuta TaxID=109671 RepID=UPI0027DE81FF|nr:ankyrin repeat domain-containing protein 50-like [Physella acuta]
MENGYRELESSPIALFRGYVQAFRPLLQCIESVINCTDSTGNTPLMKAASLGNKLLVRGLLSNPNIDKTIKNGKGQTAFMMAAAEGHTQILKLLYNDETNVNDADHTQQTALMLALKGNHDQAAKWLLNKSESLAEIPDASGSYPLHIAATTDKANMCQELLRKGAYLDEKDDQENTALMIAAEMGSVKAFRFLLKFDPNIEGYNKEGRNVLSIATYKRHNTIVDIMMKKFRHIRDDPKMVNDTLAIAAEVDNDEAVDIMFRYTSNSGDSNRGGHALVVATKKTHIKTMKALLKYEAPIDCVEDEETPLCAAAQYSQARVVQLLLDYNANVNLADIKGWTPLIHATVKEKVDIVKMLLKNGAIVDKYSKSGRTPLMFASRKNNPEIIEILLENGANVNHADLEGNTSLIITAKHGNDRALQRLLKEKPNTESQRTDGFTALSIAAKKGHAVTVHILLNNHANVHALDVKGQTALHHAVDAGHLDVVRILIENNANIKQVDSYGYSLLMIAKRQQRNDIVKYPLKINGEKQTFPKSVHHSPNSNVHTEEKQTFLKSVHHSPDSNVHNGEEQTYLKSIHHSPESNIKG